MITLIVCNNMCLSFLYVSNSIIFSLVIEALQIDLQKNFTLLKEMDGYAQGKKIAR